MTGPATGIDGARGERVGGRADLDDPVRELFASSTLSEHLVRGVVGLVLAVVSLMHAQAHPWALLGLPLAVAAWRGCPTCWSLGLVQTLGARRRGVTHRSTCENGSCR